MVPKVPLLTRSQELILGRMIQRAVPFMKRPHGRGEAPDTTAPLYKTSIPLDVAAVLDKGVRAKRLLLRYNLRLVYYCAKYYRGRCAASLYGDLIIEGMGPRGLERAVLGFDPERGGRFSTYAVLWIRSVMERCLAHESTALGLPKEVVQSIAKINAAMERLSLRGISNSADLKAVEREAGVSAKRVKQYLKHTRAPRSLEAEAWVSNDGDVGEALVDQLPDDSVDVMETLRQRNIRESLNGAIAVLEPTERQIVQLRYGLTGDEPWTLAMIGERLGVSAERIRQLEVRAIRKLRVLWKKTLLEADLVRN